MSDWSNEHMAEFLKNSPDLLCIANEDGYFIELSDNWEDIMGYTIDELKSKPYTAFIQEDFVQSTNHLKDNWMKKRDVFTSFENVYITKGGGLIRISWRATKYIDGLTYAIGREITHEMWGHANEGHAAK
ncbi:MAG: PAS domain S-box protein [Bacteroidia bacterium]|nr:PAS domain-containing protein [Bacteroidia bacterium]NNC84535.1 PAS domain S-box protein [Bacteroidia bacterium]NNM15583.1 PAS domain S-box protein [Bacteroidia bacterium]